jgi:hypothetical protein
MIDPYFWPTPHGKILSNQRALPAPGKEDVRR